MILQDKKVFLPSVIVYKSLKSNKDLLICSGEITLNVKDVLESIKLRGPNKDDAEVYVPRERSFGGIPYQRDGAWGMSDRKQLLYSIYQELGTNTYFMFYRGGEGSRLIEIMDGANRLETQRSFMFGESILMPNGKDTPKLKVDTDPYNLNELPSTYEDLPEPDKQKFMNHRIRTNLYFVLNKTLHPYSEEDKRFMSDGALSLVENCVQIEEGTEEAKNVGEFCATQFIAFNKGKQNNLDENRRADPTTNGLLSRTIDDICKDFGSNYYGFKVKRAAKQNYIAEIAFTVMNRDKEFLGKSKGKEKQINQLYIIHKEHNKDTNSFIKDLHLTIDNLKMTSKIYNEKLNTNTSKHKSFATGDCFTNTDGFLLTAYMFNEVFKTHVIKKEDDYVTIGQICSDLYSGVYKHFQAVKKAGGLLAYKKPKDSDPLMHRLSFDWYYAKTKYNGSMARVCEEKWRILKEIVDDSTLTSKTKRKHSWDDKTYSLLLDKAGYKCRVTDTHISRENCEIAHIVSLEDGGTNELDNLEALSPEGHAQTDPHRHLGSKAA